MKKYDKAEELISASPQKTENKYYQALLLILKGILQEKKYLDYKQAQQYYIKGINDISVFGKYGDEYSAYAYYGLSRISEANGDKKISNTYRKEAKRLADVKKNNFDK